MSTVVLSSTYAGNIHYFSKIAHFDLVETEVYDNYLRQTYRNRCQIATADGIMDLTNFLFIKSHPFNRIYLFIRMAFLGNNIQFLSL